MNKLYAGAAGCALILGGMGHANAADDKISLKLGGYYSGAIAFVGIDGDTGRDYTFGSDSEVYFKGQAMLDSGLIFGFKAELELEDDPKADGPSADQIDEAYIYFQGGFGKIEFGQNDGIGDQFAVQSPRALQEIAVNDHDLDPLGITDINTVNETSDDYTKITYISPALSGLKFGVSFTPEAEKHAKGFASRGKDAGDEIVEVGIAYVGKAGKAGIKFGTTYVSADDAGVLASEEWSAGLNVDVENFVFGASYRDSEGDALKYFGNKHDNYEAWEMGLGYKSGKWLYVAQYGQEEGSTAVGTATKDGQAWMLAARYAFAKGFRLGGGILYENDDVTNMDGIAVVVETAFRF